MTIRVLFMQSQAFYGADTNIHATLMRHFDRSGVEVHVACTTTVADRPETRVQPRMRAIPDVRIRPTDFGPSLEGLDRTGKVRALLSAPTVAWNLLKLAQYIRRENIQVLHATEKPRDAFYAVLLGRLTGAKSVVHMHVNYGEWLSGTVQWAIRHADAVIGVSEFTSRSIIDAGVPSERVHVAHNSLDAEAWEAAGVRPADLAELGVPSGAPVVGIVARLFSWKGHGALLDALPAVVAEVPETRLVIVGEDDPRAHPGRGSYRTQLEEQARELHVHDNVIFTGFRSDVPALMSAFDVFALPTWEEPFGMVFLEAMALRKPVVAWASGGALEVIVDGETGILVEPRDTDALAEALVRLLGNEGLRQRMGVAGRERVCEVFTPDRMCAAVVDVYRKALRAEHGKVGRPNAP